MQWVGLVVGARVVGLSAVRRRCSASSSSPWPRTKKTRREAAVKEAVGGGLWAEGGGERGGKLSFRPLCGGAGVGAWCGGGLRRVVMAMTAHQPEPFAASKAAQEQRRDALGSNPDSGRAELLAQLEEIALRLHTQHGLEVGVVVLEPRGCVRAFGTADEVVGDDFVETVTRAADVEPVLRHYRELTGTFDGADPSCGKCAAWRRSQCASTNELRKRTSMTELLSVPGVGGGDESGSGDSSAATPMQTAAAAAAAELEAAECEANAADAAAAAAVGWGAGLARQAQGLCRLVEPWLADLANDLGDGDGSEHRAKVCTEFLEAVSRGEQANTDGRGLSAGLARGLRVMCTYRSANRSRLLSLARSLCVAIAAENASVDTANMHAASRVRKLGCSSAPGLVVCVSSAQPCTFD